MNWRVVLIYHKVNFVIPKVVVCKFKELDWSNVTEKNFYECKIFDIDNVFEEREIKGTQVEKSGETEGIWWSQFT